MMRIRSIKFAHRILIAAAPLILLSTILLFRWAVAHCGREYGLLLGFSFYWLLWCIGLPLWALSPRTLISLLRPSREPDNSGGKIYWTIVWLPALGTFGAVFLKYAVLARPVHLLLALLFALVNAPLEEILWRGLYAVRFHRSLFFGYLYPAIFFGLWHLALYFSAGNLLSGGLASLVGGAFVMGLIWGWVAWKTRSLFSVCIAHALANFFAFTGYLYELLG